MEEGGAFEMTAITAFRDRNHDLAGPVKGMREHPTYSIVTHSFNQHLVTIQLNMFHGIRGTRVLLYLSHGERLWENRCLDIHGEWRVIHCWR